MQFSKTIIGFLVAFSVTAIAVGALLLLPTMHRVTAGPVPPTTYQDVPGTSAPTSQQDDDAKTAFDPPSPRSAAERVEERHRMVEAQIARGIFGREAIRDQNVLAAMRAVPRHAFVPASLRADAYDDTPLPIGHGQTISQPYIVALMTEQLALTPEKSVLEIGTGSGYQAAVLAHLTPNVYTIEIIEALEERAAATHEQEGYGSIESKHDDGYYGWEEHAPFDAIIVTCAAGHLPPPLWEQLKPGGRIVVPIGGPYELQRLVVMEKRPDGSRRSRTITDVRFVPLTRSDSP